MGRGEASQPPRHSSHHIRHSQSQGGRNSYEILDDRLRMKHRHSRHKNNLNLAESKSASQAQTRSNVVENWLEQNARQRPHPEPSRSQGHRGEVINDHHPPRPHDATSPYNKHSRRADPGWRPRHVFPSESIHQLGPLRELGIGDARKSTRGWAAPSDSSFISGFENSMVPLKRDPDYVQREYGNNPPVGPLGEVGLEQTDASSTTSRLDEPATFKKKPRRKTREDKYETGKRKRHREEKNETGHGDHQKKKRKKSEKRRSVVSSKNVVNNFTSDAVLNDRITMQPHLKPGLFDNGRTSKKQSISDLAFSEMQFLKYQKRSHQPKALSRSRTREKQREDREMEEVSTFFLPPRATEISHELRRQTSTARNDHFGTQRLGRQFGPVRSQELSNSPTSNYGTRSKYRQIPREETTGSPSVDLHEYNSGNQLSDKNTTYFTWSSSRYSPRISIREDRTSPNAPSSVWTSTPEPIRRQIIATGIFRDTGIPTYDDNLTELGTGRLVEEWLPSAHCTDSQDNHHSPQHRPSKPQKVEYRDQAIMTDDHVDPLNQLKGDTFTLERKRGYRAKPTLLNDHVREDIQRPESQKGINSIVAENTLGVDRQQIAREIRLGPVETSNSEKNSQNSSMLGAQASSKHRTPELGLTGVNQSQEEQSQTASGRVSVASRDAMPPPPIPHSKSQPSSTAHSHSAEDVYHLRQGDPSTIAAAVMSQNSPARFHNGKIQDTHELAQRCKSTTPFEAASHIEQTLSSFDTITWIPQRIPSARIIESRNIPSRLSMNSPIYVNQLENDTYSTRDSHRGDLVSKPHVPESIAEFIARIEDESQLQSYEQDGDIPDFKTSQDEFASNNYPLATELNREQPSVCRAEENRHYTLASNLDFPYPNLGGTLVDEDLREDARHPPDEASNPRAFYPAAWPMEDSEEHSEMMNFWRPNQFSWF